MKRPFEVEYLCGDCSKVKKEIGWEPKTKFKELVKIMLIADLERWQKYKRGEIFPWDAPNFPENINYLTRRKD